ncbi:hypothetical protein AOLI_G00264230 [Acnodon oligacanthus]
MSGTSADISQVHWKQQWLENGTLFFHVSMSNPEQLAQATQPTVREPAQGLHEHMHLLHISVMLDKHRSEAQLLSRRCSPEMCDENDFFSASHSVCMCEAPFGK